MTATATATPTDITRPGVRIKADGRNKWHVTRDRRMGVIWDEGNMARGRYCVWSPFTSGNGIVLFTDDAEAAVDALLATLPISTRALAEVASVTVQEVREEVVNLGDDDAWPGEVVRTHHRRGLEITGPAALAILEALATRAEEAPAAEEAAPVPGEPEYRTLKGLDGQVFIWGEFFANGWFSPAGGPRQIKGAPVLITVGTSGGLRTLTAPDGRTQRRGVATRYWVAPVAG